MSDGVDLAVQAQFRDLVADRFGLRFDDARLGFLGDLLQRRADARGLTVESYLSHLGADAAETGPLVEELTVGETYFFRDGDQFRALAEVVLPELLRRREAGRPLSFLSAGCSSGEEPYTIAMLTSVLVPASSEHVSIRAVDVNPAALQKARNGRYGSWPLRETPPDMLQRWFVPQGREMVLAGALKRAVRFDQRNLLDPGGDLWGPDAYDVVFCRNVIMYLTMPMQRAVVAHIAGSLVPGGYLFLGHAETLRGLSDEFRLVQADGAFFYQRQPADPVVKGWRDVDTGTDLFRPAATATPADDDRSWYEAILGAGRRIEALVHPAEPEQAEASPSHWSSEIVLDLLQRERFAEALTHLDGMPAELGADPDIMLLRGLLLAQNGELGPAGAVCRRLLARDESNVGANYVLALCDEGSGDSEAAMRHYTAAARLDPRFAMPHLRGGMLARRSGQLDDARRQLRLAIDLLAREEPARLLLFGGGFTRGALSRLCEAELSACGAGA